MELSFPINHMYIHSPNKEFLLSNEDLRVLSGQHDAKNVSHQDIFCGRPSFT